MALVMQKEAGQVYASGTSESLKYRECVSILENNQQDKKGTRGRFGR